MGRREREGREEKREIDGESDHHESLNLKHEHTLSLGGGWGREKQEGR